MRWSGLPAASGPGGSCVKIGVLAGELESADDDVTLRAGQLTRRSVRYVPRSSVHSTQKTQSDLSESESAK